MAETSQGSALSGIFSSIGDANPYSAIANAVSDITSSITNTISNVVGEREETQRKKEDTHQLYLTTTTDEIQKGFGAITSSVSAGTSYTTYIIIALIIGGMIFTMAYMSKNKK